VEILSSEHPRALIEAVVLVSFIRRPAQGSSILERIFASEERSAGVRVLTSIVRSDHWVIVAVPSAQFSRSTIANYISGHSCQSDLIF